MEIKTLGAIIAFREFLIDRKKVTLKIGKPEKFSDSEDFYCPFQFVGFGTGEIKFSAGVDTIQALYLALEMIGALLVTSDEYKADKITWLNTPLHKHLGFPVPNSIGDLVKTKKKQ